MKPTKYEPPHKPEVPVPKPRKQRPAPIPRTPLPRPVSEKVKRLIDEKTPYYKPEAISEFQKILRDPKSQREIVTEQKKALKGSVKSFEVAIVDKKRPSETIISDFK